MDPDCVGQRDCEGPERILVAQLGLDREREVGERRVILDSAELRAPVARVEREESTQQRPEPLTLELGALLGRLRLELALKHEPSQSSPAGVHGSVRDR
jgi:hypothetical protein